VTPKAFSSEALRHYHFADGDDEGGTEASYDEVKLLNSGVVMLMIIAQFPRATPFKRKESCMMGFCTPYRKKITK
jgi:hypothetical protein